MCKGFLIPRLQVRVLSGVPFLDKVLDFIFVNTIMKQKEITFICPYCLQRITVFSQNKANHIRWCEKNPKRNEYISNLKKLHISNIGHVAWNKGLTVKTDIRVANAHQKITKKYESGELKGSWSGRHHTEETKQKLSNLALKSSYQRICKKTLPYKKSDGTIINLDSSYERILAEWLDKNNIEWNRPEPLNWIDTNGISHHYFPDFYIPSKDLYLDPKNEYCFNAQKEKIQYILNHYPNVKFLHKKDLSPENLNLILGNT